MLPISANLIPIGEKQLAIGNADTPVPSFGEDLSLFARCKEAMYAVVTHCPTEGKRALLPAYTCETVIQPFRQEGWEFAFYPYDVNLRFNGEAFRALLKSFRPNLVVAQMLYGVDFNDAELELLREAKKAGCFVLADLTQGLFSDLRADCIDAYVSSIRKWLPLPDGGFLRWQGHAGLDEGLEPDELFHGHLLCAAEAFRVYLETGDSAMLRCSKLLEHDGKAPVIALHAMSDFSKRIYASCAPKEGAAQRMENARYLWEHLQDCKSCKPIYKSIDDMTTAPLWFPVYVPDKKEFLVKVGRPYRFSAPGLWPVETPEVLVDDLTRWQYSHIVAVTCSQNFTTADMQRIVEAFRSWDAELTIPF